jgi:hypothetical protein
MFKLKTIILILLLAVIAYQIYKLYSYNYNIVNTSQKILINSIEHHNDEIMNRIQLFEENVDIKMAEYYKKMSEVYNKTTEINKMNNQTIINQYNQYEDNDINQNNNCIYNSDESIPNGPENNKNPFIKPTVIDKELYMSSNSSSTSHNNNNSSTSHNNNNSVIQIEQNVLQHTESNTSNDEEDRYEKHYEKSNNIKENVKNRNKSSDSRNKSSNIRNKSSDSRNKSSDIRNKSSDIRNKSSDSSDSRSIEGGEGGSNDSGSEGGDGLYTFTVPEMFKNIYNQKIKVIDITDKITVIPNDTP